MKRCIHYEAAFEACLRRARVPYVAVNENRRALAPDDDLKSFDFLVDGPGARQWLVDVKGRRFARTRNRNPRWETWISQGDLEGLARWEQHFGQHARGLLVFAFWLDGPCPAPPELVFSFRKRNYLFVAIEQAEYAAHARIRSRRWGTLTIPTRTFIEKVRPLEEVLRTDPPRPTPPPPA